MREPAPVKSITVSDLVIYPVKSARGITVDEARVTDRGFEHDRRFMIIDANDRFVTRRQHPRLARLGVEIRDDRLALLAPGQGDDEVPPASHVGRSPPRHGMGIDV